MTYQQRTPIGFAARLFPNYWRPLRQEIAFAERHGFDCFQVRGQLNGLTEEQLGDDYASLARALNDAKIFATMEIVVLLDAEGRSQLGTRPLDVLKANLPAIEQLACSHVHLHMAPQHKAPEETWLKLEERLLEELAACNRLAQERGFRFAFEHNEPDIRLFPNAERSLTVLQQNPELGFVWDFNHSPPQEATCYIEYARQLAVLHVSDTPAPELNYHLPLGMGTLDIDAYCRGLLQAGFEGPSILEIGGLPKSGGFGRDTDEALIESAARLRNAWQKAYAALESNS
jgi:Sugar phosphate isomerases/epimerases